LRVTCSGPVAVEPSVKLAELLNVVVGVNGVEDVVLLTKAPSEVKLLLGLIIVTVAVSSAVEVVVVVVSPLEVVGAGPILLKMVAAPDGSQNDFPQVSPYLQQAVTPPKTQVG